MGRVPSVGRSRWRSVASSDRVSRIFDGFFKCTNCANACKRCNEHRPCERCVKYGIQNTCMDGVRKERQKGIKRGPYKRKSKNSNSAEETSFVGVYFSDPCQPVCLFGQTSSAENGEPEWQGTNETPQPTAGNQPSPPIPPMPHYPPPPEGYYPYFYPPPPGFVPPGHEGQAPEGGANGTSQPPPMISYYPIAPPGFFHHYASVPPGAYPPPLNGAPVTTIDPADASKNVGQSAGATGQTNGATASGKKRSRASKGETKTKRRKAAAVPVAVVQESPTSGGTAGGSDRASDPANSPAERDD